ncbi:MAG: hypothetical protein KME57_12300 [Scytonema hyalinum WJT4-NPBG1]|nr:hypothetical protein [Scytonema hyalinum WJT4-NPBG1]
MKTTAHVLAEQKLMYARELITKPKDEEKAAPLGRGFKPKFSVKQKMTYRALNTQECFCE